MHSGVSHGPVRNQLEKVLASPGFLRNERLSKFLRFVVEHRLEGKTAELKESVIGIEVFGRAPGYDSRQDSVVRTEAAKLRARLSQYYAGEGTGDPLVIELPKGGYTPVFREAALVPERRRRLRPRLGIVTALASLVAVLAGAAWWLAHRDNTISIAVLPLHNLSQDPDSDYFTDGLTDEIIRNLSIIEGLAVRSQTSSFAFKGKPRNVREAGKQLDADYILEGSVLRPGRQLRINAQLVRVRDDFPIWSGRFDRELTDVVAIQDEISRGIVNSLRLKLGRGRRRYETSAEAYDLYLRARASSIREGARHEKTLGLLEETVAKDPSFAPAYAALASAHAIRSGLFSVDMPDAAAKMRAAAERAIQLDPLLAEAHDALGMAYARDAEWEQSERSFRRALQLDSSRSSTRWHYAFSLLWPLGRMEEALHEMRAAEKADPLSLEIQRLARFFLIPAGRYGETVERCQKLPDSSVKNECLGRVLLNQGKISEAIPLLEAAFNHGIGITAGAEIRGFLGNAYARAGRREDAEKLLIGTNPFNQAVIFAGLGDKDHAFEAMDRGTAAGPFRVGRQLTWPELALLRGDPRVKALRKKVGLPE